MIDNIERIGDEARSRISAAPDAEELDKLRVHYLGKKGLVTSLLHQLKELDDQGRKSVGAVLNKFKADLESILSLKQGELERIELDRELSQATPIDLTLPGTYSTQPGSLHPITQVVTQAIDCLKRVGFSVTSGPEVETEFYNFEALNTPANHPARDMQDTFYIDGPILLRSHTSPMQIRTMQGRKPPIQGLSIGKVYRSDYDVTHTPMFHQIEGFMVDQHICFADLKGLLYYFVKNLFGARPLRFRPSFFPFTEPSAEIDMQCLHCKGNGKTCRQCGSTGWLEIGGCGMIHPNVLRGVKYDPDQVSGFAFGMGVERIVMLKYAIDDIRSLFENDHRMLKQF